MAEKENTNANGEELQVEATASAETLKPGAGSGGTESKAHTLSTFTDLLAQLGKEDLSDLFNKVQDLYGPNKAPGAEDKAASNRSTVDAKPSAAVGKGAWKEDLDEMFGDELNEQYREKIEVVFEAAVNTRTNLELARLAEEFDEMKSELEEQFDTKLEEATNEIAEGLVQKMDQYLDYCVEQWMTENQLAIENSLRADIAENFLESLRNVFAEHYITIPDEKIDLVAEMKSELEELKAKLNETVDHNIQLQTVIEQATKEATIEEVSEGLAETQAEKLRVLAEGLDYTDAASYRKKLEIVKEQYFKTGTKSASTGLITEEIDGDDGSDSHTTGYTAPGMDKYVMAIKKAVK
jgi:hypothetical protein